MLEKNISEWRHQDGALALPSILQSGEKSFRCCSDLVMVVVKVILCDDCDSVASLNKQMIGPSVGPLPRIGEPDPRCFSVCCFFKHDRTQTQTMRQADGLLYPSGAFPPLRVGWQENQSRTNLTKTTDTVSIIIFSFLMALSHDTFLCKILKCLSFLDAQTSLAPTPLSLLVRQTSDFHSVSVSEPP